MVQPKIKQALYEIWMAPTRKDAFQAFDVALATYSAKYPKAMACLEKDKEQMLAFYDFPAAHWQHNPDVQAHRIDIRHRASADGKNKRMRCPPYDPGHGI